MSSTSSIGSNSQVPAAASPSKNVNLDQMSVEELAIKTDASAQAHRGEIIKVGDEEAQERLGRSFEVYRTNKSALNAMERKITNDEIEKLKNQGQAPPEAAEAAPVDNELVGSGLCAVIEKVSRYFAEHSYTEVWQDFCRYFFGNLAEAFSGGINNNLYNRMVTEIREHSRSNFTRQTNN
jgi:hypothetical protein